MFFFKICEFCICRVFDGRSDSSKAPSNFKPLCRILSLLIGLFCKWDLQFCICRVFDGCNDSSNLDDSHLILFDTLSWFCFSTIDCDCLMTARNLRVSRCGVATISRLLQIIGLFNIVSLIGLFFAKETYNFKEPTDRSHPIRLWWCSQVDFISNVDQFLIWFYFADGAVAQWDLGSRWGCAGRTQKSRFENWQSFWEIQAY